jgi:glycosyltransferase involved in cell wall biosynthesis
LYDEALAFGIIKKKLFILFCRFFSLYDRVVWHATGLPEIQTIYKNFPNSTVKLARVIGDSSEELFRINEPNFFFSSGKFLKLVFISRISKEKNLIYAINLLRSITFNVEYHIYGPIEDENIWRECLDEMKNLPDNVRIFYGGEIERDYVKSYFLKYDLFLFPTHIENYGHVISESLAVGTPVLISDNTPWRNLKEKNLGWDINLNSRSEFLKVLNECFLMKGSTDFCVRSVVKKAYGDYLDSGSILEENVNLFKLD